MILLIVIQIKKGKNTAIFYKAYNTEIRKLNSQNW